MRELYDDYLKPLERRWKIYLVGILMIVNLFIKLPVNKMLILNILCLIGVLDIRYLKIPNSLIISLLVLATINMIGGRINVIFRILVFLSVALLMIIYSLISKIGGGDVKLISVLSLVFGLKDIFIIFALSIILAAITSIFLLLIKKAKFNTKIPLSPFIVVVSIFFLH